MIYTTLANLLKMKPFEKNICVNKMKVGFHAKLGFMYNQANIDLL